MSSVPDAASTAAASSDLQQHLQRLSLPEREGRDQCFRRIVGQWSEMPTLVGVAAVQEFARDELGVELKHSLLRHATEQRRIELFKLSAKNAYSPAGVVRFVLSLSRPVAAEAVPE